jgi:hypothetical protein
MSTREVLQKARLWVVGEIAKAKLPYQDPFTLTSIQYAIEQGSVKNLVEREFLEKAFKQVHWYTGIKNLPTHDVFTPHEASSILGEAARLAHD